MYSWDLGAVFAPGLATSRQLVKWTREDSRPLTRCCLPPPLSRCACALPIRSLYAAAAAGGVGGGNRQHLTAVRLGDDQCAQHANRRRARGRANFDRPRAISSVAPPGARHATNRIARSERRATPSEKVRLL